MNFSYWIFQTARRIREYFKSVLDSLDDDGLFMCDFYGGSEAMCEQEETRKVNKHFTYIWDQHRYNPITGEMDCKIHFKFPDGSMMRGRLRVHLASLDTPRDPRDPHSKPGSRTSPSTGKAPTRTTRKRATASSTPTTEGEADLGVYLLHRERRRKSSKQS